MHTSRVLFCGFALFGQALRTQNNRCDTTSRGTWSGERVPLTERREQPEKKISKTIKLVLENEDDFALLLDGHSLITEQIMPSPNQNQRIKEIASHSLNLMTEELIGINQVPKTLQNRVHVSTIWRWTNRGIKGVKLETIKLGGKTLTSHQALTRFLERTKN